MSVAGVEAECSYKDQLWPKMYKSVRLNKKGFPVAKGIESSCNAGDTGDVGLIPELGRSLGEGHGHPFNSFAWRILWTD